MTTLPNPHHPTSEDLFAYRDGELTADRRALIEAHVLACVQCRERIDEMSSAEADLRQRPDPVGSDYFDRMTESVMARIGSSAPVVAARQAREPAASAPDGAPPAPPRGGARAPRAGNGMQAEVPPVERRRPDYTQVGEAEPRRRLRLPWIGVAGSAAAAVAVVVVAVILFQRQEEWLRAPRPATVGESDQAQPVPSADSSLAKVGSGAASGTRTGPTAGVPGAPVPGDLKADGRRAKDQVKNEALSRVGELGEQKRAPAPPVVRDEVAATAPMADAPRERQESAKMRLQQAAPEAGAKRGGEVVPSAPPAATQVRGDAAGTAEPSEAYANVIRGHGLPPVWSPSVSTDAVTRAEASLRFVYQSGRAGADSARIRLYLAEAERARLDPSNTEAVESISHHYRRAISLAHGEAAVVSTARRRLSEFEEEMIRIRGTQP